MPPSSDPTPDPTPDFAEVAPDALVQVGFVFRPHGLDGELKVNPEYTDDPTRFETLETVYLGKSPHRVTAHQIASVRYQETKRGTTVILGLDDVASRTDAEAVAKLNVFASEEDLELGDDEVFIQDLVGLEVVSEAGEPLGTVANYKEMPAQDVFVVRHDDHEETLIPAVEPFIVEIDVEEGRLVVRPVDGLFGH